MNTLTSKPKQSKIILLFLTIFLVAGCIAIGVWFAFFNKTDADNNDSVSVAPRTVEFAYDTSKAPNWTFDGNGYPGDTAHLITEPPAEGNPMVVAKLSKVQSGEVPDNCFATYMYWEAPVPENVIELREKHTTKFSTLVLNKQQTYPVTINTRDGVKTYDVHFYSLDGEYSGDLLRGVALGYTPLGTGYIEVRAYCATSDELPAMLDALGAISFQNT